MVNSIWRYSHLILAIASSLFVVLAAVTGMLLAIEPIADQVQPYKSDNFNQLSVSHTMVVMDSTYDEVLSMSIDANDFLTASVLTADGEMLNGYFDPSTAAYLGAKKEKSAFFQFITNLHRSLFLKGIGRFFVGLASFLLSLIALTGLILLLKRQGGWRRMFSKIVYENFAQFFHVYIGRLSLIPILILSLSGVYLSMLRFEIIPQEKIQHAFPSDDPEEIPHKTLEDIALFKTLKLKELKAVEFPFSEDRADYFTIDLVDKSLLVDQYNGEIVSEQKLPLTDLLATLNLNLHTGQGSSWWAFILGISCINILFFVYSGFAMTLKRKKVRVKNYTTPDKAQYILLVGSETGSTMAFAAVFHKALVNAGQSVYLATMNEFKRYQAAEHYIVFTSTYGQGEAPHSASTFLQKLSQQKLPLASTFSVVGFGSLAYENFCKYAFDVHQAFLDRGLTPLLAVHTINDKSLESFEKWSAAWQELNGVSLTLETEAILNVPATLAKFEVHTKQEEDERENPTFLLGVTPQKRTSYRSGDLLAIYPAGDHRERLYSIGRVASGIQLSVKQHVQGLGSGHLHRLERGETLRGRIISNPAFHFPKKAVDVVMIANGTGIAPFLGMLYENKRKSKVHLYIGVKDKKSLSIYQDQLNEQLSRKQLLRLVTAYSRETPHCYVQDLIAQDEAFIARVLTNKGVLMICGSLKMYDGVLRCLEIICQNQGLEPVAYYLDNKQIRSDCY